MNYFVRNIVVIFLFIFTGHSSAQITGPDGIFAGVATVYSKPAFYSTQYVAIFYADFTVTINGITSPNVTLTPCSPGNTECYSLTVSKAETNCTVKIATRQSRREAGWSGPAYQVFEKDIKILPRIEMPTIYPGEQAFITIHDNCGNTGCNYNWSISPGNLCPSCGPNGPNTIPIYINPNSVPVAITADCIMNSCTGNTVISATNLQQASTIVKLKNPQILYGPHTVGCGDPQPLGSFMYTTNQVLGTNYYNWQVPPFLTILSGQGTNALTVVENALGGPADIIVTAYNATSASGLVKSDDTHYSVKVCCITQTVLTANVSYPVPDKQEMAIRITAVNTINNGATAIYHAGGEVKLSTGFSAVPGSNLHAYIASCGTGYYRMQNQDANLEEPELSTDLSSDLSAIDYQLPQVTNSNDKDIEFKLIPNPTTGNFKLTLINSREFPSIILIADLFGNTMYQNPSPESYSFEMDISDFPAGMYIVKLICSGKTYSKKIIKN